MHPSVNRSRGCGDTSRRGSSGTTHQKCLDPGGCSAQPPFTSFYNSKMGPCPCRRDMGIEGPISPPRTKGGEIEPPSRALYMVRDASGKSLTKDPFPPEGRGPAEKQSVKNNNGTKSTIKNSANAEWAKPLRQHRNKKRQDGYGMGHPLIPGTFPFMFLFAGVMGESP